MTVTWEDDAVKIFLRVPINMRRIQRTRHQTSDAEREEDAYPKTQLLSRPEHPLRGKKRYGQEWKVMSIERPCEHCDNPDSSLLRVVLIGEIIRADERTLYTLIDVCETLGLLDFSEFSEMDEDPESEHNAKQGNSFLRRIK